MRISLLIIPLFTILFFCCEKDFSALEEQNKVLKTKLDTTSHQFVWAVDTFGVSTYPSTLYDVYAISPDNVWAVGSIHTSETDRYDSQGNWINPYNAVHWDGNIWELMHIKTHSVVGYGYSPLAAIFAFGENELWMFSDAGAYCHWNGAGWYSQWVSQRIGGINKIWGSSSENIYFVGANGNITYLSGGDWQLLESSTTIHLTDVWGSPHGSVVWACGFDEVNGSVLLQKTENGFDKIVEISNLNIPHPPNLITHIFQSLWTNSKDSVYIGATGRVYVAPKNTTGYARELIWWDYGNQTGYPPRTEAIRGNHPNDLFIAGHHNFVAHYNGKSWHSYQEISGSGIWRNISCLANNIFLAGSANGMAIIARGNRISIN